MSKRDFKDQLSVLKYRVDNNKMRSYMRKELGSEKLVEREIQIVQSMLNNRCKEVLCHCRARPPICNGFYYERFKY